MAVETPNTKWPSRRVSVPKEVTKHANPSSNTDQHEGSAKYDEGGDVNEVKRFLKKYVDRKFNTLDRKFIALEALIKTNHTETIRAIGNEVHAAEKEMDDQEDPTMAADFGQAVIDDSLDGSVMRPKQPTEAMEDVPHTTGPTEVEGHVPAAEHDVCADGDFHPDRTIQSVLMELSEEVSEPVNPPEVVHVLDVEESTKDTDKMPTLVPPQDPLDVAPEIDAATSKQVHGGSVTLRSVIEEQQNNSLPSKHDTTDSTTSTTISEGTYEALETFDKMFGDPATLAPLHIGNSDENTQDSWLLRDSQLFTTLPTKQIMVHGPAKTVAARRRQSSKWYQSPFLNEFGSTDKGKEKMSYTF